MTSPRGSTSRKFAVAAEIDSAAVRRINSALLNLSQKEAGLAMRRGFTKWGRFARATLAAAAPMGRATATEFVRGSVRPNVHLKFNVQAKVKGFRQGLVQWVAVGIKEIPGSYLTPHWYLRWVEYGHLIVRAVAEGEPRKMVKGADGVSRYNPSYYTEHAAWTERNRTELVRLRGRGLLTARGKKVVGRSGGTKFISRTAPVVTAQAERYLMPEIEKALQKV